MLTSCFRQETSGSNVVLYMLLKQGKESNCYLASIVSFPERATGYGCHSSDLVGLFINTISTNSLEVGFRNCLVVINIYFEECIAKFL
jgi:hypothetical protein